MSPLTVFTLVYLLFAFGLIMPPNEFVGVGLTIQNWFSALLGQESLAFITYHIKKSMLNLVVYSCLPLFYFILLLLFGYEEELLSLIVGRTIYYQIFVLIIVCLPVLALIEIRRWSKDNYKQHPIVKNLRKFATNDDWEVVASNIECEFRRIEKVCISVNPLAKVVVTENWIMKVTPITIFLTHQSDASLVVKSASNYHLSHVNSRETQFLNIEVKGERIQEPFVIRINANDFVDLQDRISRSISILPNVHFHKTVVDQFLDVFKTVIEENPKYSTNMELDQCMGCLQTRPNVKLQKNCEDKLAQNNCTNCFCKPMWCADCLGKWFVSRQDPDEKNQWLSSKCTCPMCRATFCLSDVCLLNQNES